MNRFAATPFLFCSLLALSVAACGDDGNNGDDTPDAMEPGQPDAMEPPPAPDAAPDVPPDAAPPTPEIVVSADTLTVNEGSVDGATITVELSASPGATLAVMVASSDPTGAVAAPGSLDFDATSFGTEQTVTVTAPNDPDGTNETLTLTLSGTGLVDVTVAVTVIDDDSLNILAEPTTVTVDEGGTAGFGVSLTVQPDADVTVSVASGDEDAATVDVTTLTFTPANYDQAQTVTASGVDDADAADNAVAVTLTSAGLTDVTVAVTVADDDTQTIQASAPTVSAEEGGATGSFTVRLSHDPLGAFDVNVASGDTDAATASPATLTFDSTNYDQPQTVTITGVSDLDASNESVVVTLSATGVADATVTATITDNTPPLGDMYVRGSFNAFGLANQMTYAGARRYTEDVTLSAATHELKIADAAFGNDTTFSVSPASQVAIALDTATPLVRAPGLNNNTLLTITQPGIYRFELLVNDVAVPVLTVSLVEAAPFGVNMFVRFTGPVVQDVALAYQGNSRYRGVVALPAGTFQNFKIADINLSATTTFARSASMTQFISLNTATSLVVSPDPNIQILLIISDTGNYQFDLNATSTTSPVLTVSLVP